MVVRATVLETLESCARYLRPIRRLFHPCLNVSVGELPSISRVDALLEVCFPRLSYPAKYWDESLTVSDEAISSRHWRESLPSSSGCVTQVMATKLFRCDVLPSSRRSQNSRFFSDLFLNGPGALSRSSRRLELHLLNFSCSDYFRQDILFSMLNVATIRIPVVETTNALINVGIVGIGTEFFSNVTTAKAYEMTDQDQKLEVRRKMVLLSLKRRP